MSAQIKHTDPKQGAHVVDDDVDTLDVDTTTEDVGSDQDTLLESLERRVSRDSGRVGAVCISTQAGLPDV
jgi:hypothetical protein